MALVRHCLLAGLAAVVGAHCTYQVVDGDNRWAIATSKFDVTLDELYRLNPDINNASRPIYPGHQLVVPCTTPRQLAAPRLDDDCTELYHVQPGDYCHKISVDMSLSIQSLMQWNSLTPPYVLWPGQLLCVSKFEPVDCAAMHTVRPGDTCYALAQLAGLSLDKLIKLNPNLMSHECPLLPGHRVCLEGGADKRHAPESKESMWASVPPSVEHDIVVVMNNFVGNWTDSTPPAKAKLMPSTQELDAALEVAERGEFPAERTELGLTRDLAAVVRF